MSTSRRRLIGGAGSGSSWSSCWLSTGCRSCWRSRGSRASRSPFSPYFLEQLDVGPREVDHGHQTGHPGHLDRRAEVPRQRQEGDGDDVLLDAGPVVLEHSAVHPGARVQGRGGQREEPESRHLVAGGAAARASGRRCCWWACSSCFARRAQGPRAAAWEASGTSAAARRGGSIRRRSGSRLPMWPGSTRPRAS